MLRYTREGKSLPGTPKELSKNLGAWIIVRCITRTVLVQEDTVEDVAGHARAAVIIAECQHVAVGSPCPLAVAACAIVSRNVDAGGAAPDFGMDHGHVLIRGDGDALQLLKRLRAVLLHDSQRDACVGLRCGLRLFGEIAVERGKSVLRPLVNSKHPYAHASRFQEVDTTAHRFRRGTRRHAYERQNPHSRSSLLRPHHSNQKCADEQSASSVCKWESLSAHTIPACSKRLCVYAPGLGMFFPS